jgi:hypothetical protein
MINLPSAEKELNSTFHDHKFHVCKLVIISNNLLGMWKRKEIPWIRNAKCCVQVEKVTQIGALLFLVSWIKPLGKINLSEQHYNFVFLEERYQ